MSDPKLEEGRRHIERFRAPEAIRDELTDVITQAGSLAVLRKIATVRPRISSTGTGMLMTDCMPSRLAAPIRGGSQTWLDTACCGRAPGAPRSV